MECGPRRASCGTEVGWSLAFPLPRVKSSRAPDRPRRETSKTRSTFLPAPSTCGGSPPCPPASVQPAGPRIERGLVWFVSRAWCPSPQRHRERRPVPRGPRSGTPMPGRSGAGPFGLVRMSPGGVGGPLSVYRDTYEGVERGHPDPARWVHPEDTTTGERGSRRQAGRALPDFFDVAPGDRAKIIVGRLPCLPSVWILARAAREDQGRDQSGGTDDPSRRRGKATFA